MSVKTISPSQARTVMCGLDETNLEFKVKFKRRTDGKIRTMACRFRGNIKNPFPGKQSYDPADHNCFLVYDTEKRGPRNIPLEGIQEIKCAGETLKVDRELVPPSMEGPVGRIKAIIASL